MFYKNIGRNTCAIRAIYNVAPDTIKYEDVKKLINQVSKEMGFPKYSTAVIMSVAHDLLTLKYHKTDAEYVKNFDFGTANYLVSVPKHIFAVVSGEIIDDEVCAREQPILCIYEVKNKPLTEN